MSFFNQSLFNLSLLFLLFYHAVIPAGDGSSITISWRGSVTDIVGRNWISRGTRLGIEAVNDPQCTAARSSWWRLFSTLLDDMNQNSHVIWSPFERHHLMYNIHLMSLEASRNSIYFMLKLWQHILPMRLISISRQENHSSSRRGREMKEGGERKNRHQIKT